MMRDHYVYWVRDLDGVLLYVGCTNNPDRRYDEHMCKPHDDGHGWFNQFPTTWRLRGPLSQESAQRLEMQQIAQHQPIFNTSGVKGRGTRNSAGLVARYFTEHGRIYPIPTRYRTYPELPDCMKYGTDIAQAA